MDTIFSENPEKDLWRELLQFTYEANIQRFMEKRALNMDDDTINSIIGSLLQANEYYESAKDASLQILPLLLYYGSVNLCYGMVSLLTGKIPEIKSHGMKIKIPMERKFIADTKIIFNSPHDGGVHVIAEQFGFNYRLTNLSNWTLKDFLDSIAEINFDFKRCYDVKAGCIAMLDVFNTPDGVVEKIYYTDEDEEELDTLLKNVEGFDESYLTPQSVCDSRTGEKYFVLRHTLTGQNISKYSFSGQPYLQAGHKKNSQVITIPSILNMYIGLFVLASLCRYHPQIWSPFVLNDSTGEKLLIEKFLYYSRRLIPNIVLNKIQSESVTYSFSRYKAVDRVKLVGEHQLEEMVERQVRNKLKQ